ncbi:MAG: hypothetical protein ACR2KU_02045 [Gammaproteobacteria bacterium]
MGLSAKTIRYYEDIRLVPPPTCQGSGWFSAGRRVQDKHEIERLQFNSS